MPKLSSKSVSDLIGGHCTMFMDNMEGGKIGNSCMPGSEHFQLDYLRFYVPHDKWSLYGTPRDNSGIRDNPNWEPTGFPNVYKMTDYKTSLFSYNLPNVAPVSVLRWEKVKVKKGGQVQELIQICIYGKGLKLFYSGHLSRLQEYVVKYQGECTRVDLCWDFKHKLPGKEFQGDLLTDLKRSAEYLNSEASDYDTIYYGKKHSPFMIRIYNKTADLRKDKNIHSFLYPSWYKKECWRYEVEIKGAYANSNSPLDRLLIQDRTLHIQKIEQTKRNNFKTALYSLVNCIDCINYDEGEKIMILQNTKDLITQKLKVLYGIK